MQARFHRPSSLQEALQVLADGDAMPLAGGTDIFPALANGARRGAIVDLSGVRDLRRDVVAEQEGWSIGAGVTWTHVLQASLPPMFDALKQAACEIGGRQIQNRGTVVGNVCNASPAADGIAALLALDASVRLQSLRGERELPLGEFVLGNRRTARAPDELVVGLFVPRADDAARSAFRKLGARRYLVISIAMAAVLLEGARGRPTRASIAVGSCHSRAVRTPSLEREVLRSGGLDAGRIECEEISPIDDVRSGAGYRRRAAPVLVADAVQACLASLP